MKILVDKYQKLLASKNGDRKSSKLSKIEIGEILVNIYNDLLQFKLDKATAQ